MNIQSVVLKLKFIQLTSIKSNMILIKVNKQNYLNHLQFIKKEKKRRGEYFLRMKYLNLKMQLINLKINRLNQQLLNNKNSSTTKKIPQRRKLVVNHKNSNNNLINVNHKISKSLTQKANHNLLNKIVKFHLLQGKI